MNPVRQSSWVLASRIVPQLSGVMLLIIGARFLAPEFLGRFVLIFAGVEFLRRLVRAGWREAVIIDRAGGTTAVVMTMSVAGALAAQAVTLLAAAAVWRWSELGPQYPLCIILLGATLLPLAPTVVWEGIVLRRRQAEREAKPLILAETVHLVCAFVLLSAGLGILGLAWARVARAVVLCIGLGWAARWPAAMAWDRGLAAAAVPISANVTASSLINFATTYGIDFIVGFYLGPASVAFFRIGSRIAGGLAEVVNETVRVLAWSTLPTRTEPADPAAVARSVDAFLDRTVVLAVPVFVGLALVSEPLVRLLMGETWQASARVVALIAVARMLQVPAGVAWPALALVGKTEYLPRLSGTIAGSAVALVLLTGSHGLQAIAWSQVIAGLLGGAATLAVINRAVFPDSRVTLRPDTLAGLAIMAAMMVAVRYLTRGLADAPGMLALSLGLQVLAGGSGYLAFLRWRRRELWLEITAGLRRR